MSADVAFETPEQIASKLARYEELFQYRYTERDDEYRQCLQNASRVLQVPMMDPWPPRGSYSRRGRYEDWDGRGRRRGYRGRRRDYHHPPYHHPHPPRYYDDRPPWGYGPLRSPRDDFRDRSPIRSLSPHPHPHYHRHGSSSPLPYPPQLSPHHPPHLSPRHPSHLSPHRPPYRSRSRSHSPVPRSHSPWRETHTEGESANEQESPPQMPHTLNLDLEDREEKAVVPSESDVRDILSSAHALQSHVTAENLRKAQIEGRKGHHSRKDERDANRTGKKLTISGHGGKIKVDPKSSGLDSPSVLKPSVGSLLITHGKTETVSTPYLLGSRAEESREGRKGGGGKDIPQKKKKQKQVAITESEDGGEGGEGDGKGMYSSLPGVVEEGVARVTPGDSHSEMNVSRTSERGEERGGLVMRLDKKFCHTNSQTSLSGSVVSHSVPSTPSSDITPTFPRSSTSFPPSYNPHRDLRVVCNRLPLPSPAAVRPSTAEHSKEKKKKKKKKKKQHKAESGGDEGDELITQGPLRLKISLGHNNDT